MRRMILMCFGVIALALSASQPAQAQIGDFLRKAAPAVKLPNPLEGKPPVSTNIADAVYGDPSMDSFNPDSEMLLTSLARDKNGGFVLRPGYYTMDAQTYCLHAGTYGPTAGDGYLYAPVKGSAEAIVTAILQNSTKHPQIAQHDIQLLLWAIVARAKFENLDTRLKLVASQLLTQKQLLSMNRNALDVLTSGEVAQLTGGLPEPLARIARAEANMRQMLSGGSSYSEIERVAVLAGVAPRGAGSIDIPDRRWSLHPDGYWVRYDAQSYSHTKVEVYVAADSKAVGKVYDPATAIAVPVNTAKQRLGQSARVYGE